ncbi:hypothetical protein ACS0TY_006074 [Phlomoides rotata]
METWMTKLFAAQNKILHERDMVNATGMVNNQRMLYQNLPQATCSEVMTCLWKQPAIPTPPFQIPEEGDMSPWTPSTSSNPTAAPQSTHATSSHPTAVPQSTHDTSSHPTVVNIVTHMRVVRERKPSKFRVSPYTVIDYVWYQRFYSFMYGSSTLLISSFDEVNGEWFREVTSVDKPMENVHIDTYLRILHDEPQFVNMGPYQMWEDTVIMPRAFTDRYLHQWIRVYGPLEKMRWDPSVPESEHVFTREVLGDLVDNVRGSVGHWRNGRVWHDVNYVVMIINVSGHFMTCRVNLKMGRFTLFDPLMFKWKGDHIPENKAMLTTPWRRFIPLVIKYAGLYEDKPNAYRGLSWDSIFQR